MPVRRKITTPFFWFRLKKNGMHMEKFAFKKKVEVSLYFEIVIKAQLQTLNSDQLIYCYI